jgi:hypothetical protein
MRENPESHHQIPPAPPATSATFLLDAWYSRIARVQIAHFSAAMRFGSRNIQMGLPAIILSTIVGTSVFASLNNDKIPQWATITVGVVSVFAAVLAASQTFLSFSERAEKHRITAVRYGAVGRQIEQFLETGGSAQKSPETLIDEIRERLNRLAEESPVLPPDIVRQATIDSLKPIRGGETAQK